MKNIFRLICLTFGLCLTTLPTQALEFEPYTGGGLGAFVIDAGPGGHTVFGAYGILGADLHENFGVELRAGNIGGISSAAVTFPPGQVTNAVAFIINPALTPVEIDVDWFVSYLLKLQYPIDEKLRLYGLIGGTTLHSNIYFINLGRTGHTTKTTLSFGGGADYRFNSQWLMGIDVMIYANDASTDLGDRFTGLDVWGLTATLKYKF